VLSLLCKVSYLRTGGPHTGAQHRYDLGKTVADLLQETRRRHFIAKGLKKREIMMKTGLAEGRRDQKAKGGKKGD